MKNKQISTGAQDKKIKLQKTVKDLFSSRRKQPINSREERNYYKERFEKTKKIHERFNKRHTC